MNEHVPMQLMKAVWGKSCKQRFGHTTHMDYSRILLHYSGIMLVAQIFLLFRKLCQHNSLKFTSHLSEIFQWRPISEKQVPH